VLLRKTCQINYRIGNSYSGAIYYKSPAIRMKGLKKNAVQLLHGSEVADVDFGK